MASQSIPQKRCNKCGRLFPNTDEYFYYRDRARGKLKAQCKTCLDLVSRLWEQNNKERLSARKKKNYRDHIEERRAYHRQWRADHPDVVAKTNAKWVANNLEKQRMFSRNYRRAHPEKGQQWRSNNREKFLRINRRSRKNRRDREMNAQGEYTKQDIADLYEMQCGRCAYCGIPLRWGVKREIHIDHMAPLSRGGSNWPSNLALTCQACNLSKGSKTLEEWRAVRGW